MFSLKPDVLHDEIYVQEKTRWLCIRGQKKMKTGHKKLQPVIRFSVELENSIETRTRRMRTGKATGA
jgi:hypothetical protein